MALYPPSAVCQQLYHIHPQLRLAWHVYSQRPDEEELNPGDFAVVQLYHISNAGTAETPNTYFLHWEELGDSKGLIFNRNGGSSRDWDPLFRRPIYVANLREHGITREQVFSGEFLNTIKYWLRPARVRLEENAKQLTADMRRKIDDIAREKTDYLWSLANRADADTIIMPYSDAREQMAVWEAQRERNRQLDRYFYQAGL